MCEEQRLERNDFFPKRGNLGSECIVFTGKDLDLCLQAREPLLLALATF